jgi:hypothetical protein
VCRQSKKRSVKREETKEGSDENRRCTGVAGVEEQRSEEKKTKRPARDRRQKKGKCRAMTGAVA